MQSSKRCTHANTLVNLDMMAKYKDSTSSLPAPTLNLFRGALVMLTRNFMPSRGLVNGAVFIVESVNRNTVNVVNVGGSQESNPFYGSQDVLFRFTFPIDDNGIKFTRKQYPLRFMYAGTTHRLQGDTVHGNLLIDVTYPAFLHGQAYVTFSRARCWSQIFAVCQGSHFTSLTFLRMLEHPRSFDDSPNQHPENLSCDPEESVDPGAVEQLSSDSDRDDPFDGTGADWVADDGVENTGYVRRPKRVAEQDS